jgi:hypothetical protein
MTHNIDGNDVQLEEVSSSYCKALGHDGGEVMVVQYSSGKFYRFYGITASQFADIMNSASIGRAIHQIGVKGVPA